MLRLRCSRRASCSTVNTSCGDANGTLSVAASGGTGAYTYAWSNGATTATVTGLAAGSYSVTVTDAKGCTATTSGTVRASGSVDLSIVTATPPICAGGTDGRVVLTLGNSGLVSQSYRLNGVTQTDSVFTGLSAGSYEAIAGDFTTGCLDTVIVVLTAPSAIAIEVTNVVDNVVLAKASAASPSALVEATAHRIRTRSPGSANLKTVRLLQV